MVAIALRPPDALRSTHDSRLTTLVQGADRGMSVLILVFTPAAPPVSELAAALAAFVGGRTAPGELFDDLAICESSPSPGGRAGAARCVRLVPSPRDAGAEALRLARHWPPGLAPAEAAVLRVEYDRTTVGLVRSTLTELAERFRFFVETGSGRLFGADAFTRRCVREPGAWWEEDPRSPGSAGFATDLLPNLPLLADGMVRGDEPRGAEAFAAWRSVGEWLPPGAIGDGHLAVLAVASLASGPAFELSGRVVPGLLGWFARRLRLWEGELRAREPELLRRPAAYLFVAARAVGPEETRSSERLAWYPGVVEGTRGYGEATHGPAGSVDVRLGELLDRAARMIEAG